MSLEKAIEENTAVMRELIAIMSGAAGAIAPSAAAAATATATAAADKPRREKKQTEGETAALKLVGTANDPAKYDWEKDVQAILGFYPFEVDDIDQRIADILGESIKFTKFIVRNDAVYFQVTSQNLKEFLASQYTDASYKSKNEVTVDWLSWILYGGTVDADLIFSTNFARDSKSGRAIMLHVGTGDWDAADYDVFPSSDSGGFIKELLNSEEFVDIAQTVIADNFRKAVGQ